MRIRIRFAKHGKVRWTSHRDVARMWERAIRRARLPVAYSQGFNPHPRLHFGLALSTGHESDAEYLDIDLDDASPELPAAAELPTLVDRLTDALPVGLSVVAVAEVSTSTPSLQQDVTSAAWRIEVRDTTAAEAEAAIERALSAAELPITRQRKGKDVSDDARPYLLDLAVVGPTGHGVELSAHLATQPRGLRSGELLAVLGLDGREGRVRRTHQFIERDGERLEPLPGVGAPDATTAPPRRLAS